MTAPVVSHTFKDMTCTAIKNPAPFSEKTEFLSKPNVLMNIPLPGKSAVVIFLRIIPVRQLYGTTHVSSGVKRTLLDSSCSFISIPYLNDLCSHQTWLQSRMNRVKELTYAAIFSVIRLFSPASRTSSLSFPVIVHFFDALLK